MGTEARGETVLVVEDNPTLLRVLKDNFESAGYRVRTASDGEVGLACAVDERPDLVILDLMLPKVNGYEICRLIRKEGIDVPIIMLTAKDRESDVVLGLELGADDYVTKPFSIRELLARAGAFLRRRRSENETTHRFGRFELALDSRTLVRTGARESENIRVDLTPREFDLLAFFLRRPGRVLSRDEILRSVWGHGVFVTPRSVDRCVTTLRAKIESDPRRPRYIKTVLKVGYRFESDSDE